MDDRQKIEAAIQALEAQRLLLGDGIVETALAPLREKLAALTQAEQPEQQRKQVTVLFCDVVGSTRLTAHLDPEEIGSILDSGLKIISAPVEQFGGKVIRYMGDGFLAVFGVTISLENDPEQAVRCGLAIVKQAQNYASQVESEHGISGLNVRVGINTGFVLQGGLTEAEGTLMGGAVNLGARLESAASPGTVLISQATYRHVRGLFDFAEHEPVIAKGFAEPVAVYTVLRARPAVFRAASRGVAGIQTHTAGRQNEFARLVEGYERSIAARSLVWVQLIGEAGLGKSRLLNDLLEHLSQQHTPAAVLKGKAMQGDERKAYELIRRLWFDLFDIPDDLPLDEAEQRWETGFTSLAGADEQAAAHALGLLLGLPFANSPHIGALRNEPTQVRGRAIVVSHALLDAFRQRQPVVLLLEDLHWADPASWDYLVQVGLHHAQAENGLFFLGTARPEWHPPVELTENSGYTSILLEPLTDEAMQALTREIFQNVSDVPSGVVDLVIDRAEGVPYYAEELINWFLDQGVIDSSSLPWRFRPERLEHNPMPATLQHLLLTRLNALNERDRWCLHCGSVFGRSFWEGGLRALGADPDAQAMSNLTQRGYVSWEAESSFIEENEWSFYHALLRDVTYESLLRRKRKGLHLAAANWLEEQAERAARQDEFAGVIGEHRELAGESVAACRAYLRAGQTAFARGAVQAARQYFERALALAPENDPELRWQVLVGKDSALGQLADSDARQAADAALLALAQEIGNPGYITEAYLRQGSYLSTLGRFQEANQAFAAAIKIARAEGNTRQILDLLSLSAVNLTHLGEMEAASEAADQVMLLVKEVDENSQARPLMNITVCLVSTGQFARAVPLLEKVCQATHRQGDRFGEANCLLNLGYCYLFLGDFARGIATLESSTSLSDSIGAQHISAFNRLNLGLAYFRQKEYEQALSTITQSLDRLAEIGDAFGQAAGRQYLGMALEGCSQPDQAREAYEHAREGYSAQGMLGYAMDASAGLARLALAGGEHSQAVQWVTEILEYFRQNGASGIEFPVWTLQTSTEIFDLQGNLSAARECAQAAYQEMQRRLASISEPAWRESFITNIPEHSRAIENWQRLCAGQSQ